MTKAPASRGMDIAFAAAEAAGQRGEVPVGAAIVSSSGEIIAADGNRTRELADPTAHAEMLVIRAACRAMASERLVGCDLYVTLEPCPMCAAAMSAARIRRLYYGAADPKSGGVEHGPRIFSATSCHHRPEVFGDIGGGRSATLLKSFFLPLRDNSS